MCIICDNHPSLYLLTKIYCGECQVLTAIPYLPNLRELNCSKCTSLVTIPALPNLTYLECWGCLSLSALPILPNLKRLWCWRCISLTEILSFPLLESLNCTRCISLNTIHPQPSLARLNCGSCSSLKILPHSLPNVRILICSQSRLITALPYISNQHQHIDCSGCWVPQAADYQVRIAKLMIIQRYIKKYFPIRVIKRYIRTEAFTRWFYDPENFGGYKTKRALECALKKIIATQCNQ